MRFLIRNSLVVSAAVWGCEVSQTLAVADVNVAFDVGNDNLIGRTREKRKVEGMLNKKYLRRYKSYSTLRHNANISSKMVINF